MALLVLLAGLALAAPPPLDAVVLVLQGSATCAGAFVDAEGHVATAYHCVAQGGRPRIETRDGRRAIGRVVAARRAQDVAIVAVPDLAGEPFLPLREDAPEPGEAVWAMGHPFGARAPLGFMEGTLRWSVTQGVVAAVGPRALQVTAAVNPGNSGGPVVDAEGRLVGVVSRRLTGEALGFAARADVVADLLEEPRGYGWIGGVVEVDLFGSAWEGEHGTVAVGLRVETALRDRVVLGGALATPIAARWDAVRFGAVRWSSGELRAGLRQRLFRGPWTTRLEGYGGLAAVTTLEGAQDLSLTRRTELAPMAGGGAHVGAIGVDVAGVLHDEAWAVRGMLVLKWPGPLWML